MNDIRESIFNLMKAYGYVMKMFDEDGNGPLITPLKAQYIYANKGNQNYMYVIEDDDTKQYNTIDLYRSDIEDEDEFREILKSFKDAAIKHSFSTTIKNVGRGFSPKDFSYIPGKRKEENEVKGNNIEESFSVAGTKKTSYHAKESARVIVKHKNEVDESAHNGRSRNISEVLVATRHGERRKVSEHSLAVGKAVANHVNNGGELFDKTTNLLVELGKDLVKLRKIDLSENALHVDKSKEKKIRETAEAGRKVISKLIGTISRRKTPINGDVFEQLAGPEYDITKAFFECMVTDEGLAESLARASILKEIL